MRPAHLLVTCLLALSWRICWGKRKGWGNIDFEKLEKEWEKGDEDDELKTEAQVMFDTLERRKADAANTRFDPSIVETLGTDGMAKFAAAQKDMTGPSMMFAKLKTTEGGVGVSTGKEKTSDVSSRLQQLALLGGLEVAAYPIDEDSILVSTQRGWEGKQVLEFLLSRPEVSKVTWNQRDFTPATAQDL